MLGARSPTGRAPYTHLVGAGVGGQVAGRAPYTHLVGAGVGGQVAHREGALHSPGRSWCWGPGRPQGGRLTLTW